MDEALIKKTINGVQNSSLEYMKRYSLCDCVTLGFPETYNAMGLGLDVFNSKIEAGKKYIMPYANKVSEEDIRILRPVGYKTPKEIETFLWSPFHDSTSTFYDLGDDVIHSFRFKGQWLRKYSFVKQRSEPLFTEVIRSIKTMKTKIYNMWGSDVNCMLLFYDNSRLNNKTVKKRMERYNEISLEVLHDWHELKVELTEEDKEGKEWEHYKRPARMNLLDQIKKIEDNA